MSAITKGNNWCFGMKAHVGVNADCGIVHSLETTTAKAHDSQIAHSGLFGQPFQRNADRHSGVRGQSSRGMLSV
jgi:IS5 family transposase